MRTKNSRKIRNYTKHHLAYNYQSGASVAELYKFTSEALRDADRKSRDPKLSEQDFQKMFYKVYPDEQPDEASSITRPPVAQVLTTDTVPDEGQTRPLRVRPLSDAHPSYVTDVS